jgi:hypothetical protein
MSKIRTILLTGGGGKLGRVWVAHLLACGHRVLTTTRRDPSLREVLGEHAEAAQVGRLQGWSIDLAEAGAAARLANLIGNKGLQPDALINNARSRDTLRVDPDGAVIRENFSAELLIDVVVPYELTMAIATMKGSRLDRVVNVSSMYGIVAANPALYDDPRQDSPIHYSVAKAALIHLTRELAVRLAPRNICVNTLSFGGIEGRVDEGFRQRYARLSPQGRMLQENDTLAPLDFLLSDGASGVTGHNLVVDGGWSAW